MELSQAERIILDRFEEKCRMAGGPRVGFVLRKEAIRAVAGNDVDAGLSGLVEKGLLLPNEEGSFYFLSQQGVEALQAE